MFVHMLFAIAIAASNAPQPPVASTSNAIVLSPGEVFRIAEEAQQHGDIATAEIVYRALTDDRSSELRNEARFRLAMIYASQREYTQSALLLQQIVDEQPSALRVRLELARILALLGDLRGARRELRAAEAGRLPPDVAQVVDRFSAALRSEKSFGGSLNAAYVLDSNINRATRSDTLGTVIGDFVLDKNAKARSGEGLALDGQVFQRVDLGGTVTLLGTVSGSGAFYNASQFDDVALVAKLGPELQMLRSHVIIGATVGRRWFGGQLFTGSIGAALDVTQPLSASVQLHVSATADQVDNHQNPLETGAEISGTTTFEKTLSVRAGAGFALTGVRRSLRDPGYSTTSAQVSFFGYRQLGKTAVAASVSVGRLLADRRLLLFPERRSEWFVRGIFGATFRQFAVRGFAPTARLTFERNRSTIGLYDYRRMAVDVGVTRAF